MTSCNAALQVSDCIVDGSTVGIHHCQVNFWAPGDVGGRAKISQSGADQCSLHSDHPTIFVVPLGPYPNRSPIYAESQNFVG